MPTPKIAVIGECMIEMSEKASHVSRGFGGDTLNTAVYIARLVDAQALAVHYVTALGEDNFSQQMLEAWQQEKVHTELVQRMPDRLPGLYYIQTDERGERSFLYWRSEAAARYWLTGAEAAGITTQLEGFDYLYLSGISLAILPPESRERLFTLLEACRRRGGKIIFDNNYRPRLWSNRQETQRVYRRMLACTDIAFLTLDDEDALWGPGLPDEVIARTHAAGVQEVIIKRGAESCLVARQAEPPLTVPAITLPKERVVDTTAAGDSFSAGYLSVRLTGGTPQAAAECGHRTASAVIQHRGAIIPRELMPK
ncbi:sugar kinase [Apirhabdus apintestini]|uniref:sugar kinase n=1 Tax=Erwinia sp. HR93 TaxID=3094840 RepID=UPI002ADEEF5F|nr:sugar kinase [Erwinia sp. HR93]MEA1063021.1 sugar kinase [Erwinia sp. HR93]WPM84859.1 sugar kinase [Enterobacteriaceae bacterium CA-0114]